MTFNKPSNIRYTDMCILIDKTVFEGDYNEPLIYEYIYHIINMLAHKLEFFKHADDYDQFSLYLASVVYMRLINKKKPRIKSILNYIKRIIGLRKITYEEKFILPSSQKDIQLYSFNNYDLANYLIDESSEYDALAYNDLIEHIDLIVYNYIKKIPYRKDSSEWHNIYISVVLTLLNMLTLNSAQERKLTEALPHNKEEVSNKIYQELRHAPAILYHLEDSFQPYIKVLATEIKHAISSELSSEYHYFISSEATLKNLLAASCLESNNNED